MKLTISLLFALFFTSAAFGATFTVTRNDDRNVVCTSGDCSLREAVTASNNAAGNDTINFDAGLRGQTITLAGSPIRVMPDLYINGLGANQISISGNDASRIFYITSTFSARVIITDVTLKNGNGMGIDSSGNGGAIYSTGSISLIRVVVRDSGGGASNGGAGSVRGGGAYFGSGISEVLDSTFTNNSCSQGGAIYVAGSDGGDGLDIINSTISGNAATLDGGTAPGGGGIIGGNLMIRNSTITKNSANTSGGGIYSMRLYFSNSIIYGNTAPESPNIAFQSSTGTSVSLGSNLVGSSQSGVSFAASDILNADPKLGILRNNGGTTLTHALLPGSPAIDKGSNTNAVNIFHNTPLVFDQREENFSRFVDGNGDGATTTDIGAFERQPTDALLPSFDFDGDRKSDVSVFRPSNSTWYLNQSSNGFSAFQFGANGDQIAPADYDGDGKTDLAVFRPSNGAWYLLRSTAGFTQIQFGAAGDLPMPADFDGDGKAEIAVFRPSTGVWYQFNLSNNQTNSIAFGLSGDTPTAGDYDGDGKADIAVFRLSNGTWYLNRSTMGLTAIQFGTSGDKAVPNDYDGDGKTDLAVWRPSNGVWYLQQSTSGFSSTAFGITNDLPAPADFDGDGKADLGVFRPSAGTWYLQRSTQGFTQIQFGVNGDKPIPNAFVP